VLRLLYTVDYCLYFIAVSLDTLYSKKDNKGDVSNILKGWLYQ